MFEATGEAPVPIVFLHGFATSTQRTWVEPGWFDLVKEGGRRPIGIDLLGHGDAEKPTNPEAYQDLAGPVVEQLPFAADSGRQIDIVGYSLGARTALDIAVRFPGLVRRLVLGGVGRNLIEGHAMAGTDQGEAIGYRFDGLMRSDGQDPDLLRTISEAQTQRTDRYFTADTLATVTAPALLVIGSEDFAGPPEPLAELLPNVEVTVLAGVDHFNLPKQFGFIDAALEFLDCVPAW
jgi:pimeloyl-ACP methyl ester carboxylesterase